MGTWNDAIRALGMVDAWKWAVSDALTQECVHAWVWAGVECR